LSEGFVVFAAVAMNIPVIVGYYTMSTDIFTDVSKENDIVFMVYFSPSQENIEKIRSERECKLSSIFINILHSQCTFPSISHCHTSFS
jgi:hypothetical protein